jgi:glycosyltransferase involved in cell wall biosynthesis
MKPRLLILYERSIVGLPHSSAHLRLLRPLFYPAVQDRFYVTAAPLYAGQEAELVIVDRTWRPDLSLELAIDLVEAVRGAGAKLIYHLDDDLLNAPTGLFTAAQLEGVAFFLRQADALLVSTPRLAERFAGYNDRILVAPNALDERLLASPHGRQSHPFHRPFVVGYMGTRTHDEDLRLILPALHQVGQQASLRLELHLVGGVARVETTQALAALPFPVRQVEPPSAEYPEFMLWFTGSLSWDLALAPLVENDFTRVKSDVKFLDYSALGAPGIYSSGPVYSESVQHRVTGWLAAATTDSWREAILTLIEDAALRRELAANAHRHLFESRILAHRCQDWIAALETVWYG